MMRCALAARSAVQILAKRKTTALQSCGCGDDKSAPSGRMTPSCLTDFKHSGRDIASGRLGKYLCRRAGLAAGGNTKCVGKQSRDSRAKRHGEARSKLNPFAWDWFFALGHEKIWT